MSASHGADLASGDVLHVVGTTLARLLLPHLFLVSRPVSASESELDLWLVLCLQYAIQQDARGVSLPRSQGRLRLASNRLVHDITRQSDPYWDCLLVVT